MSAGGAGLLRGLGLALLVALAAVGWRGLVDDPLGGALEDRLLDLRFALRGPIAAPGELLIVAMDEAAVDRFGWTPPPREALAEAVERISGAGAAVLAIDLLLVEDGFGGERLARAIASSDRIVLAAALADAQPGAPAAGEAGRRGRLDRSAVAVVVAREARGPAAARRLLLPAEGVAGRAALAHVNIGRGSDRVARRVPLALGVDGGLWLPAMSLEAARRVAELDRGEVVLRPGRYVAFGARRVPTDAAGQVVLNHYGGRGAIRTVGFADVAGGAVAPDAFAGRAVFLGASAESLADLFATPFASDVPGVEVLATLTGNLLDDDLVVRDETAWALTLLISAGAAGAVAASFHLASPLAVLAGATGAWAGAAAAVQVAFAAGLLWTDATAVAATLAVATGFAAAGRLGRQRRLAETLSAERANLARFVPPALVGRLSTVRDGASLERTQFAALLFVDVVGFTALSEAEPPQTVAAFLRGLHGLYEETATAHGGVILGFEGDGALIVFGLPEQGPGDAARALSCGLDLRHAARTAALPSVGRVGLRVSLHHGPVTVSVIGGKRQAQFSVAGDAVNVASRLQEVAKTVRASLVASGQLLDAASGGAPPEGFHSLGCVRIRGRRDTVEVWADVPPPDGAAR